MLNDLISTNGIKKVACYPWLELQEELHAIFVDNRHPVRSWFRVFSILLATGVGLFLVFNDPAILEFFAGIIKAINFIPDIFQQKAAIALSVLASSSIGAYTSKAVIRGFCKFRFGDPDFFLTPKKTQELIIKFKEQEIDISAELIEHVVAFCVHNLREAHHHTSEIGTKPKDWEQILNALIYDADLDLFLEQQAALEAKHKHILEKQELIKSYKLAITKPSNQPTTPVTTNSQQPSVLNEYHRRRSSTMHLSFNSETVSNHTPPADERTPLLLSRQTSTYSEGPGANKYKSNSPLDQQELLLAKKVVAKFKHTHAKKHHIPHQLSEEHLVEQCCKHLEHRACCTNRHILTLKDIELASRSRSSSTVEAVTAPLTPTSPNSMFTTSPAQTPSAAKHVVRSFISEPIPDIALQQPSPQSSMYHMPIIPTLIPKT
jgi:hypothetical protein